MHACTTDLYDSVKYTIGRFVFPRSVDEVLNKMTISNFKKEIIKMSFKNFITDNVDEHQFIIMNYQDSKNVYIGCHGSLSSYIKYIDHDNQLKHIFKDDYLTIVENAKIFPVVINQV